MSAEHQAISETIQTYFDGLHEGDTEKLGAVFHPCCHLFHGNKGELIDWDRTTWFERVDGRPSPRSQGKSRHDRIVSIDMSDQTTALAKVECAIPPRYFTDYLMLLKIDGRWQIVSKSYRYVDHE